MELRHVLADEIASGVYPVGARFPTDQELCERFNVSRHTVREALRALQDERLIVRRRGFGTVIGEGMKRSSFKQVFGSIAELDRYAHESRLLLRSEGIVVLRPYMAKILSCPEGSKWLRLAGTRVLSASDEAIGWTEIYIGMPYIAAREKLKAGPEPYFEQISKLFGFDIFAVKQQISAVIVPRELRKTLGVTGEAPALLVRRQYFRDEEEVFEVSLSLHPADRYIHEMSLPIDMGESRTGGGDHRLRSARDDTAVTPKTSKRMVGP